MLKFKEYQEQTKSTLITIPLSLLLFIFGDMPLKNAIICILVSVMCLIEIGFAKSKTTANIAVLISDGVFIVSAIIFSIIPLFITAGVLSYIFG